MWSFGCRIWDCDTGARTRKRRRERDKRVERGFLGHRSLQVSTHFAAFFEIYKTVTLLHRSRLQITKSPKNRETFAQFLHNVCTTFSKCRCFFSTVFVEFCADFDEVFSEFRKVSWLILRISQNCEFLWY